MSLRLVEVLSHVQRLAGGAAARPPLGLPEPGVQRGHPRRGGRAASGSLHTEGLAADVALPARRSSAPLWLQVRAPRVLRRRLLREGGLPPRRRRPAALLGAGDVARRREPLGRQRAPLRAHRLRPLHRRRDDPGALHGITAPPVRIARTARLRAGRRRRGRDGHGGGGRRARQRGDGCIVADARDAAPGEGRAGDARAAAIVSHHLRAARRAHAGAIESNPVSLR